MINTLTLASKHDNPVHIKQEMGVNKQNYQKSPSLSHPISQTNKLNAGSANSHPSSPARDQSKLRSERFLSLVLDIRRFCSVLASRGFLRQDFFSPPFPIFSNTYGASEMNLDKRENNEDKKEKKKVRQRTGKGNEGKGKERAVKTYEFFFFFLTLMELRRWI